jgi:hypothetical protein
MTLFQLDLFNRQIINAQIPDARIRAAAQRSEAPARTIRLVPEAAGAAPAGRAGRHPASALRGIQMISGRKSTERLRFRQNRW